MQLPGQGRPPLVNPASAFHLPRRSGPFYPAWQRSAPLPSARASSGLLDPGPEELPHQAGRQRSLRVEMQRSRGLLVSLELAGKGGEGRSTERVVRAPLSRGQESGDHLPVQSEGGDAVADALFGFGNRGVDGLAKAIERLAAGARHARQVVVDVLRLPVHGPTLTRKTCLDAGKAGRSPHPGLTYQTFNGEQVERFPVKGRRLAFLLAQAPGDPAV